MKTDRIFTCKVIASNQIQIQYEFTEHQFYVLKNASVTHLEIAERHHSHPITENGVNGIKRRFNTGRPFTVKSVQKKRTVKVGSSGI